VVLTLVATKARFLSSALARASVKFMKGYLGTSVKDHWTSQWPKDNRGLYSFLARAWAREGRVQERLFNNKRKYH